MFVEAGNGSSHVGRSVRSKNSAPGKAWASCHDDSLRMLTLQNPDEAAGQAGG